MNRRKFVQSAALAVPAIGAANVAHAESHNIIKELFDRCDSLLTCCVRRKSNGLLHTLHGWQFYEDPLIDRSKRTGIYCSVHLDMFLDLKVRRLIEEGKFCTYVDADVDHCILGDKYAMAIDFTYVMTDAELNQFLQMFRDKYKIIPTTQKDYDQLVGDFERYVDTIRR